MSSGPEEGINCCDQGGYKMVDKEKDKTPLSEGTIECRWCYDSETGDKVLMDVRTSKEIGRWKNDGTQS